MRGRLLLVAVLVVFAGCNGVLGGGSNEPKVTLTPAPIPTDKPTPTPIPQLAPGLTGQGIENANALVAAHTSFLGNHSFTVRSNSTWIASNGSVISNSTVITRFGPPGEGFHSVPIRNGSTDHRHSGASPVYTIFWSNGKRVLEKEIYANGTTIYDRSPINPEEFRNSVSNLNLDLLILFGIANTAVTDRFTRNGTTLYRVRGASRTESKNVSFRLLVDSRGVIHEVRTVREGMFSGNVTVISEMRFSNIGTTEASERPSWVDEALNRTTPIPEDPRRRYDESDNGTETNGTASKTTTSG